jgi:putative nucleotidyltransferase with HDIG domain
MYLDNSATISKEGHPWRAWGRALWSDLTAYWARTWPGGQLGCYLLLVVVSGLAALFYAVSKWPSHDVPLLLFLIILSALAEAAPIPLLGTSLQGSTLSVASAMSFAGLLLLGPSGAILVNCGSAIVNGLYPKRRPFYKFAFNAATFLLSAAAAGALYQLMGGGIPMALSFHNLVVAALAAVTYFVVNTGLVSKVISLATDRPWRELWGNWPWLALQYMTCFAIAVAMAVAQQRVGTLGFMAFALPLILLWYSIELYACKAKEVAEQNEQLASINQILDWRVHELQSLHKISLSLNQSQGLPGILNQILHAASDLIDADASAIFLCGPDHETLRVGGHIGFSPEYVAAAQLALNDSAARALRKGRPVVVGEQGLTTEMLSAAAVREGIQSAACLPLGADGNIVGGLDVCFKSLHPFTEDEIDILGILAQQAAVAIHKAHYVNKLEELNRSLDEANRGLLETLGAVIDAYDVYTYGHSTQVAVYAEAIAEKMGLTRDEQAAVIKAALVHDIGKIGVVDSIFSKESAPTDEEWNLVQRHPIIGAEIVGRMKGLQELVPLVRHHHERWDGRGYPDGLEGEEIPLGARILALADSLDAMCSDRPYRRTRSFKEVMEEIAECSGTQFDPDVVKAFFAVARENGRDFFKNSAVTVDKVLQKNGGASASNNDLRYLKKSMVADWRSWELNELV